MDHKRYDSLDGLRGLCALSVMLYHSEFLFRAGVVFCHGYLAVDMFFILSGFVISASYDERFARGLGAFTFLKARLKRLAPVYWGGLALCVAASCCYLPVNAALLLSAAMAAVLLPVLGVGTFAYPANSVAWTLGWELVTNILYAAWLRRLSSMRMSLLIIVLLVVAAVFAHLNPRGWSFGMMGTDLWWAGTRAVPEFLIGVLLRRAHAAGQLQRLPPVTPALPFLAWTAIAVLPQGLPPMVDVIAAALVFPVLVALLVRGESGGPRWFRTLGAASYPLYASHLAWIGLAQQTPLFGLNHRPQPLLGACVVLAAVAGAWVIYRLLDPAGRAAPLGKRLDQLAPAKG